mmetsp:Transcript_30909/g.45206  ORF Transcript_30909/g.45206 Transcript_30909/m.45206 type:complete len:362 (-) Transcript_30909:77-1162(-)
MGQALSKKITPRLQQMQKKYDKAIMEEVKADIASKKARAAATSNPHTDINALEGGFQRGGDKTLREVEQENFLKAGQKEGKDAGGVQEMPEDLINFLNAAGPVQRQVDKTQTSPRLYDALAEEEEGRLLRETSSQSSSSSPQTTPDLEQKSNTRTRRRMPMVGGMEEQDGAMEDKTYAMMTTTERTTNFSNTVEHEEEDWMNIRFENEDICHMLNTHAAATASSETKSKSPLLNIANVQTDIAGTGESITPEMITKAEQIAHSHLDSILPSTSSSRPKEEVDNQKANTQTLIANAMLHTSIPALMKDEDGSLIAVWENRVVELMTFQGLKVIDVDSDLVRLTKENGGLGFQKDGTNSAVEG